MHGNTEEFKQKYRDLPDDGLLAINRDELIDSARQCYDEELARRSLTPKPAKPAEPAEGSEPTDELVCAAAFIRKGDADLAQSVLESAEIPCFQPDEHMSDIAPFYLVSSGGGRILVPASRVDQARELLAPMIVEVNKTIVGDWFERIWNADGDGDDPVFGASPDPRLRALLPDLRVTIDDLVAEADKVAARISIHGTHNGAPVQFHGVVFVRLEAGRIVDTWDMNDAPASL